MTARKAAADVEVDDGVVPFRQRPEGVLIVRRIDGVGGGDFPSGFYVGGDVRRTDVHAVAVELSGLDNAQGEDGDIVLLQQPGRQVAGAVGGNLDHRSSFQVR